MTQFRIIIPHITVVLVLAVVLTPGLRGIVTGPITQTANAVQQDAASLKPDFASQIRQAATH